MTNYRALTRVRTMFKLVDAAGCTICTAKFAAFDDDPIKGRDAAAAHIKRTKARWEVQPMFASESLRIVEK